MRTCGDDGHYLVSPRGIMFCHTVDDPRQQRLAGNGGLPPGLAGWRRVESPVPRRPVAPVVLIGGGDEMSDP